MYDEINLNQREFNQFYYKPTCTITSSFDGNGFISYDVKPRSQTFPSTKHNLQFNTPVIRKQNTEKRNGIKYKNNKSSGTVQLCHENVLSSQSVVEDDNNYSNEDEGYFQFYRKVDCDYHEPKQETSGKWPFNKIKTVDQAYHLTSIGNPKYVTLLNIK